MSKFNIADIIDFLTPGAVFTRPDGRESRVLFLTNTVLTGETAEKYPPQVVYADENDNVLSCGIERFMRKRQFYNVSPELEARLNNLLASSLAGGGDELDLSSEDVDGDGDELVLTDDGDLDLSSLDAGDGEDGGDLPKIEEVDLDNAEPVVQFTVREGGADLAPVFDIDYLTNAVASYQQQPAADLQSVHHVLFVKAEAGINSDTLYAAFSPSNEAINQTLEFAVDAEGSGAMSVVSWNTFVGVYPAVFFGSRMYQVVFAESATLSTKVAEAVAEAVAVAVDEILDPAPEPVAPAQATPAVAPAVAPIAGDAGGASVPSKPPAGGAGGNTLPAAGQTIAVNIKPVTQPNAMQAAMQDAQNKQ